MSDAGRSNSAKASSPSSPVQCTGAPISSCSSRTTTSRPRAASRSAAIDPAGPAPMMTMSCTRAPSEFPPPGFPGAPEGNPERQDYQTKIEREGALPDVQQVIPEFLTPRDVARREHLRDAGQAGRHLTAFAEARHFFQGLMPARSVDLDLAGPERARANEAHVAAKDAEQLRKLVHRSRAQQAAHPRDARVIGAGLTGAELGFRVGNHRAELQHVKDPAVAADAFLTEEHGPPVLELARRRRDQPDRQRQHEPGARQHHVESAFEEKHTG